MNTRSDHFRKFESEAATAGRTRRSRDRSSSGGLLAGSVEPDSHTLQPGSHMKALGYLSGTLAEAVQYEGHPDVEAELDEFLQKYKDLRSAVYRSVKKINTTFADAEVRAFLEHDPEDQNTVRPVIEVEHSFEDIQQYRSLKSQIREIVRSSEREGTIIYTRVNQI